MNELHDWIQANLPAGAEFTGSFVWFTLDGELVCNIGIRKDGVSVENVQHAKVGSPRFAMLQSALLRPAD